MSPLKRGSWCLRCGASNVEPSREGCKNPLWHLPNEQARDAAAQAEEQEDPYGEEAYG